MAAFLISFRLWLYCNGNISWYMNKKKAFFAPTFILSISTTELKLKQSGHLQNEKQTLHSDLLFMQLVTF